MATYNQVSYGSQGSSVTELQKLLNNNGYGLTVDGIYGAKTQAAVKDYQQKNGLAVDGIAGTNTWGALTAANTTQPAPSTTQPVPSTGTTATNTTTAATGNTATTGSYDPFKVSDSTAAADQKRQDLASQKPSDFSYDAYQKSDLVTQAEALLQQQLANKPGEYQSQWQANIDEILNQIQNREKFSYDLNSDALYQQYKDQYILQGQQAMMDTMGQAQAMTGGYGNSYAQSVGQQAYQSSLQQLNDRVPELYQLALNQYNREGEELYNQYGLYADRENQDYGRYRDAVSEYYTELDRLTNDARYQSETEYNRYLDQYNQAYGEHRNAVSDWQQAQDRADAEYWNQYNRDYDSYLNALNMAYQQDRDKVSDQQWQSEFDEAQRQFNEQMALKTGSSSGGSGGSGGGSGGGGNYTKNPGLSKSEILSIQKQAGISQDGVWGPNTAAAYDKGIRPKADGPAPTLSTSGENFMKNLPYAHAGSDMETWKNVVDSRLEQAYANGKLSASDVTIIIEKLGLDK